MGEGEKRGDHLCVASEGYCSKHERRTGTQTKNRQKVNPSRGKIEIIGRLTSLE